ncbi:MAG TPA: DUF2510 domain-containing protein [Agrococcus sp.]|nr:DUF2510 domain-containing protein [Agrococcus sp.]
MPSFLIVHSACQDGRIDAYRQPPTLDIGGLRAPLDWGDVTLHVPAGDLPVTVFVTRANGQVEGATITVRSPAGTGTRLTFVPPLQPGGRSMLRIDGQWPADSSMHYYAARDARLLARPAHPLPPMPSGRQVPQHAPPSPQQAAHPEHQPPQPQQAQRDGVRVVSPAAPRPTAPTPAVGPAPGSTGAVPPEVSSFGREQGARIDPVQSTVDSPAARLAQPPHLGPHPVPLQTPHDAAGAPDQVGPTHPPASFGQRPPRTERDVYGREHAADDRQPPPIPTPAEFHRLEREAHDAQRRVYEAWQAQQRAQRPDAAAPSPHEGAPQPVGLAASAGQAQPAWYPDPFRRADSRWFDGRQWTSSVMRGGVRGLDQPG